jgi:gamma-aminobutyric acid type B receptor
MPLLFQMISNNRKEPAVRAASPIFVQAIILGSSIMLSTTIWMVLGPIVGMSINVGTAMCTVETWSFSIGWSLTFGSLLSKTWRVIQIFDKSQTKKKKPMNDKQLANVVVGVMAIDAMLCLAWMVAAPMSLQRVDLSPTTFTLRCIGEEVS